MEKHPEKMERPGSCPLVLSVHPPVLSVLFSAAVFAQVRLSGGGGLAQPQSSQSGSRPGSTSYSLHGLEPVSHPSGPVYSREK